MGEIVFENKHAKLREILRSMIGAVLLTFVCCSSSLLTRRKSVYIYLIFFGIVLLIGMMIGLSSAVKMKKMRIVVNDNGIEVTKGKAHALYTYDDFVRCQQERRTEKVINSLVINGDGELLYVDCEGFSNREFLRIADAIRIRKHEMSEVYDGRQDLLPNGNYSGSYELRFPKVLMYGNMFLVVMTLLMWGLVFIMLLLTGLSVTVRLIIILASLSTVLTLSYLTLLYVHHRKQKKSVIKELQIDQSNLVVNDDILNFDEIRNVYITPPYLIKVVSENRVLKIRKKGESRYKSYIVEKRPATIESTDTYYQLYNRLVDACERHGISISMFE